MKCENCGFENDEGSKYCGKCGHLLVVKKNTKICPQCSSEIDADMKFCEKCGYDFYSRVDAKNNNKKNINKSVIIGAVVAVILVIVLVIVFIPKGSSSDEDTVDNTTETTDTDDTSTDNLMDDNLYYDKADYDYYFSNNYLEGIANSMDLSSEIDDIRSLYNDTQNLYNNDKLNSFNYGESITFYSDAYYCRKMIVKKDEKDQSYTREYYFDDGVLYFAFAYDGDNEYRMYYKDGKTLIRYIDNQSNIFDYGDIEENKWGYFCYQEAYDIYQGYYSVSDEISNSNYILNGSDQRYISTSELDSLSQWEVRLARNEIYARHGYTFDLYEIDNYFESKSWYNPSDTVKKNWNESILNDYEVANRDTILQYEKDKGYRNED